MYYLSASRDNGATLNIAPLTDEEIIAARDQVQDDPSGYFLYEKSEEGIRVLARVPDDESAFALAALLDLR